MPAMQMFDDEQRRQAQSFLDAQQGVSRGTESLEPQALQPEPQPSYPMPEPMPSYPVPQPAEQDWTGSVGRMPASQPASFQLASDVAPQNQLNLGASPTGQLDALEQAYEMQQIGISNAAKAGAEKAAAESAYFRQQQADMERLAAEQQARDSERQKELESEQAKLGQAVEEYGNLKVDPKRLYNNMGTSDKVVAAIGLILGAFGRNGNTAVAVLQNAINQDVDAQKANIGVQGDKLNAKKSLYAQMRDRFGDERQAEAATRLAMIQNSQLKAQEIASKYKAPEIQANAQVLFGQLEAQKQGILAQFNQNIMSRQALQANDSPVSKIMTTVPKEMQKDAISELSKVSDWNKLTNDLQAEYKTLNSVDAVSATVPGIFGGERGSYNAGKAKIAGALVGKVPGIKSDSDFRNIVEPMLPAPTDTVSEQNLKLKKFSSWLASQGPSTPILEGFGLKPPTQEDKNKMLGVGAPVKVSGK